MEQALQTMIEQMVLALDSRSPPARIMYTGWRRENAHTQVGDQCIGRLRPCVLAMDSS
jgi:hypothetical protein